MLTRGYDLLLRGLLILFSLLAPHPAELPPPLRAALTSSRAPRTIARPARPLISHPLSQLLPQLPGRPSNPAVVAPSASPPKASRAPTTPVQTTPSLPTPSLPWVVMAATVKPSASRSFAVRLVTLPAAPAVTPHSTGSKPQPLASATSWLHWPKGELGLPQLVVSAIAKPPLAVGCTTLANPCRACTARAYRICNGARCNSMKSVLGWAERVSKRRAAGEQGAAVVSISGAGAAQKTNPSPAGSPDSHGR